MTTQIRTNTVLALAAVALILITITSANAVDLYRSGSGTWGAANTWGTVTGGPYNTSTWTNGDSAFLETTQGTVMLDSNFSLDLLDIAGNTGSATNYVVGNVPGNNTLTFAGTNTLTVQGVDATINTGVAGTPTLTYNTRQNNAADLILNPGSLTQNYAATNVDKTVFGGGANAALTLEGTSTGNSTGDITWTTAGPGHQLVIDKRGSGTWEIGNFTSTAARVRATGAGGTLIVNGDLIMSHEIDAEAGTLVANGILSVTRNGVEHVRVFAGAALQPGISGIDTVTIQNDHLTWSSDDATAGMLFDLSSVDNTSDLIDITGTGANAGSFLKGAGSSFLFDFSGGAADQTYTLVNFDTTTFSVGDFGIASGIDGTFALAASSLTFTTPPPPTPEPSTFVLAALGLMGLVGFRRRRRR